MKRLGKIAVCLAGGLALDAGLCAPNPAAMRVLPPNHTLPVNASAGNPSPDIATTNNPYAAIATRNIFGLVPPPKPPSPEDEAEKNLPKITPTGIQSYFGQVQVLFKVTPKPGSKDKEEFYTLGEGERQDDIEVETIDETKSIVTFDNHGFTQSLPLADASPSGGDSTGGPSSGGMSSPMTPGPGGGPGGFTRFGGGRAARNGGGSNGDDNPNGDNANNGSDSGDSSEGGAPRILTPTMTPEQTALLIETERATLMNSPHPAYSPTLLPPTPLTKLNTSGDGGLPNP